MRASKGATFAPGSRNFVAAIVTAQMLTQIGAFTLPALLPGYIGSWSLSKTEAGWLIGIFVAAYVPDLFDALTGPRAAFLFGAAAAATAFLIATTIMPDTAPRRRVTSGFLLDFRPVFRNRRAMAWIVGYTVHTCELSALRAWAVTFLTVTRCR
jgi:hypothetical protein